MESTFRIEPARLDDVPEVIVNLVAELSAETAKLEIALAPQTARSLAQMVQIMNTYYSNLIEGNVTRPRDIESQLRGNEDSIYHEPHLLIEARAHALVQAKIDLMAHESRMPEPASEDFIRFLHKAFYLDATETMLKISGAQRSFQMIPGDWRSTSNQDVAVGKHIPPSSEHVAHFMAYFSKRYHFSDLGKASKILAIPAAHHRFNYIHPFPDGNGRVSRLMSHAMAHQAGIGAHGLWSISRGLARGIQDREQYKRMMAYADTPRQGDLDGRGNLSQRALIDFTKWFLSVCLDQVKFMASLYEIDTLTKRLRRCLNELGLKAEAGYLLDEALVRGQFDRGGTSRITGLPERSARRLLSEVIDTGLLGSETPKGSINLRFPMKYQDILFPQLF